MNNLELCWTRIGQLIRSSIFASHYKKVEERKMQKDVKVEEIKEIDLTDVKKKIEEEVKKLFSEVVSCGVSIYLP